MSAPDLPPHLLDGDGPDPEAEAVVGALLAMWGAPRWSITDDRTGEWVMSKLAAATREIDETAELAAQWRERIDQWEKDTTARARQTEAWASAHLCRWLADLHAADPKVKSRKLPSGKVTSTEGRIGWEVVDEAAAIRALYDVGLSDLVVTKVAGPQALARLLLADQEQGRAITTDGVVVDGIVVHRRPRTFKASPT